MLKKVGIISLLFVCLLPANEINAQITNAGFIPGNIWYSKDPFEEGDKIKIYTLIFNPDARELSGMVNFYDKTTILGKKSFVVAGKSVKDISIDWTVDAGAHNIFAKIENAKFLISTGKYENVNLTENQTEESSRTINKKIVPKLPDIIGDSATDGQIAKVQNVILENTPDFITKPIIEAVNSLEKIRGSAGTFSRNKKEEISNQIKALNNEEVLPNPESNAKLQKPLKYIEFFFLAIFSIILDNKWIFYIALALVVFFLIRFIWRRIF